MSDRLESAGKNLVPFVSRCRATRAAAELSLWNPARLVIEIDALRSHPVAAVAAPPPDLRPLLPLMVEGHREDELPAWAMVLRLGWAQTRVISGLLAVVRRRLALMHVTYAADPQAIPTSTRRRVVTLMDWRMWP